MAIEGYFCYGSILEFLHTCIMALSYATTKTAFLPVQFGESACESSNAATELEETAQN